MLLAVAALGLLAGGAPSAPPVLDDWLDHERRYRLITLEDAVPDDAEERSEIKKAGTFRPVVMADATGDGREDMLAVVVSRGRGGRSYELLAFHATEEGFEASPRVIWRETVAVLVGVAVDEEARVEPLPCVDCAGGAFFLRWNGREYEENLMRDGEQATLFGDGSGRVTLRQGPGEETPAASEVDPCGTARILSSGSRGLDGSRWYEVEVEAHPGGEQVRGYVSGTALSIDPVCLVVPD
jgi:hypothetical protein